MRPDKHGPEQNGAGAGGYDLSSAEMFRAFRPVVWAICIANVRNLHDAEDIMQDVFLKALAGIKTLRDRSRVRPWLLQIARRTCADHHRQSKHAMQPIPEGLAASPESEPPPWPACTPQFSSFRLITVRRSHFTISTGGVVPPSRPAWESPNPPPGSVWCGQDSCFTTSCGRSSHEQHKRLQ